MMFGTLCATCILLCCEWRVPYPPPSLYLLPLRSYAPLYLPLVIVVFKALFKLATISN